MMAGKSQRARLLAMLRAAGSLGLTAADLASAPPDEGAPILRFSARILELRRDGHQIVTVGERDRCRVFRLVRREEPRPVVEAAPVPADASRAVAGAPCSPFDVWSEWS